MTEPKTRTVAPTRMWTIALALALTCAAPAADAALARVVIDSFTVTGTPDDPNDFLFAPTDGELQSWILQAERNNGATSQTNSNTVLTWNPQTATAQTANSFANVASSIQSSFPPNLPETPNFSLTASATPGAPSMLQSAFGNMLESGLFCFGDGTGFPTSAGCNGSGSIAFDLFYSLIIDRQTGTAGTSAYSELDVTGTGVPNGLFFDFASTLAGGTSRLEQEFTWTETLGAGGISSVDLAGTVVVQAVPEPDALALMALGLIVFAGTRLRRGSARRAS